MADAWGTPPTDAEKQAAGAWDTPPTDAELAGAPVTGELPPAPLVPVQYEPSPEQDAEEADKDAELRGLFDAGITKAPDKWAGIIELAKKTNAPVDVVEQRYDEFKQSAESAGFDPQKWRDNNPVLYDLLVKNPKLAPVVFKEQAVKEFSGALMKEPKPEEIPLWIRALGAGAAAQMNPSGMSGIDSLKIAETKPEGPPVIEQMQPAGDLGAWGTAVDVFSRRRKESEIATLGTQQLFIDALTLEAESSGDPQRIANAKQAGYETRKSIMRIQQELGLPKDYEVGAMGQLGVDMVEGLGSQIDSLKAYGIGGAAGAVIAGGGAALLSKGNPTAIGIAARGGAIAMAKAAGFLSSFNQETGSTYLQFRDTKDDNGKPMDPAVAMGAAALYGLAAAGVEVATIGPMLKRFGISEGADAAEAKAALKAAMKDRSTWAMLKEFGIDWAKSTAAEGAEEGVQSMLQSAADWAGRSVSAGTAQSFNMEQEANAALVSTWKGIAGSLGMVGIDVATRTTSEFIKMQRSQNAGARIEAVTELAKSPAARAAPKEIADLVEQETARSGERVKSLFIDPVRLVEEVKKIGGDPEAISRELMGDEGPARMREALGNVEDKPGHRATLEVPVAEFLEKWGNKPFVEVLKQDIATREGHYTAREQATFNQDVEKLAKQIVDEASAQQDAVQTAQAVGPNEKAFSATIEKQLVDTGRMTRDEARKSVAIQRAFVRTMAHRMGDVAEEQFGHWNLTVQHDINDKVHPEASRILTEKLRALSPEQRAQTMWVDPNTGLFSARAFSVLPRDPARPLVAHYSIEGTKFFNKDTHTKGNQLYRLAADALRQSAPDASKWGGDFVSTAATDEEAQTNAAAAAKAMREKLRALNPKLADQIQGLQVTAVTEPIGNDLHAAIKKAGEKHGGVKAQLEERGKRAKRGEQPSGIPVENPADLSLPAAAPKLSALPEILMQYAGKMNDKEVFNQAYIDPATGLLSREGFFALPSKKHVASIDLNGLKRINTEFGEGAGDELIKRFAEVAQQAGASAVDMAHLSGDEFALQHDDRATLELYLDILGAMADRIVIRNSADKGVINGVSFGYGIGENYDAADKLVEGHKQRERQQPGAERAARGLRAVDRQNANLSQGRADLARGNRPQGFAGGGKRARGRVSGGGALASEVANKLRADALGLTSPADIAKALAKISSPESDAVAAVTAARIIPEQPEFRSKDNAWKTITGESFPEGQDSSPSEQADGQYRKWLEGRGPKPSPFPGGTFDVVNEQLGLTGDKRAMGAQHAFDLLTKGARTFAAVDGAVNVLSKVPGLEKIHMPQSYIEAQAAEQARAHTAEQEAGYWRQVEEEGGGQVDTSFDPDTFYQPKKRQGPAPKKAKPKKGLSPASPQTESPAFRKWFGGSKVVGTDGKPLVVYHGTTGDFTSFAKEKANPESDLGAGFYFSNTPEDVAANYAGVGPDLQAKMLHEQEMLASETDRQYDDPAVVAEVRAKFMAHEGASVPAYLSLKNPIVLGGSGETVLDYEQNYDEKTDEYGEPTGKFVEFAAALRDVASQYHDGSVDDAIASMDEEALDGGITAARVMEILKKSEQFSYYTDDTGKLVSNEIMRQAFERAGFDGIIDRTVDVKFGSQRRIGKAMEGMGSDTVHYIAFHPEQVKSSISNTGAFDPNDPSILAQPGPDDARGWVQIAKMGMRRAFRVFLTERSDLSTFLHESAHVYFEMLGDLAEHPAADERVKGDYATVLKWMGADTREAVTREQKEKFARGFEAFLMEGQAPSPALAESFQAFRLWLTEIYRTLSGLDVNIDDPIRGVFMRMLATDDEIKRMRLAAGLDVPLWRSHIEAGKTPQEWETYQRERAADTTRTAMAVQRTIAESQLKATKAYQTAEFKKLKEQSALEWEKRADVRSQKYIMRGEKLLEDGRTIKAKELGKLDKAAVAEILSPDSELYKRLKQRGRLIENGEHPTAVARDFGYETGRKMLEAVGAMPDKEKTIQWGAEQMMREKHPELGAEVSRLEELVQRNLHNAGSPGWLIDEWKALRKKAAPGQSDVAGVPIEAVKLAASDLVSKRKAGKLDPGVTLNRERAAAEKAAIAATMGDYKQAYLHKQNQLLQHFMWRELDIAVADRESFKKQGEKLADKSHQQILGQARGAFLDVTDQLLEQLGFMPENQATDRAVLADVVGDLDALGVKDAFPIDLATKIMGGLDDGWKSLTVNEMRDARRMLALLYTAARDRTLISVEGQRVALAGIVKDIAGEAEGLLSDKGKAPSEDDAPRKWWSSQRSPKIQNLGRVSLQGIAAALTDPEKMVENLGPTAYRVLWQDGYIRGRTTENELATKVLEKLVAAWEKMPAELADQRYDLLDDLAAVPFPDDLNRDGSSRSRQWMWMVALNMGNASNTERLLGGYGWDEQSVRDWLNRNMTKAEWDYVQGIWDLLDTELYPEVARTFEESTGLPPTKIEPVALKTPHGDYRGGYFPAKYDPVASRIGKDQASEGIRMLDGTRAGKASVMRSFTKERAKRFADVINLQWSTVPAHVSQVIHYVAFDRFVRDAQRVLNFGGQEQTDAAGNVTTVPSMPTTIQRRLGLKYEAQLDAWIKTVASTQADGIPEQLSDIAGALAWGRSRLTIPVLGLSASVALADFTNPLVAIAKGDIKLLNKHLIPALLDTIPFVTYKQTRQFAFDNSVELKDRTHNIRRRLMEHLADIGRMGRRSTPQKFLDAVRNAAWYFMETTDRITSTVMWNAAYRQEMGDHGNHTKASQRADAVVRAALPSHNLAEQPSFLRDKRGAAALTVFYGYSSKLFNVYQSIWHKTLNDWDRAEGFKESMSVAPTAAAAAGRMLAVIVAANVLGELASGRGPDDGEPVPEWLLRKVTAAPFLSLPIVGQGAEAGINALVSAAGGKVKIRPFSVRASPMVSGAESLVRAIGKAMDENRDDGQRVIDLLEAAGILGALPTVAPIRMLRYIFGDLADDVSQGNVGDVASGLIYGDRQGQPTNPFTMFGD